VLRSRQGGDPEVIRILRDRQVLRTRRDPPTYRFAPVELTPIEPFAELYHGPNEWISVKGVLAGQVWLREVMEALAAV
jgi:acetylornithine deacetylase/succinyl-diaminopimelate desuccinylase-like protein